MEPIRYVDYASLPDYCYEETNEVLKPLRSFYATADIVNLTSLLYDSNFTALTYIDILNFGVNLVETIRGY